MLYITFIYVFRQRGTRVFVHFLERNNFFTIFFFFEGLKRLVLWMACKTFIEKIVIGRNSEENSKGRFFASFSSGSLMKIETTRFEEARQVCRM